MSAQHTPGPWMVLPSFQDGQFAILTEHGKRKDIACTYGFPADPREANARLIAAAPDLLAALRQYVACDTIKNDGLARMASAAIAKATGSAS